MTRLPILTASEIEHGLRAIPGWALTDREIVRIFRFAGYLEAMCFVNLVAEKAELVGHHPDIDIRYNRVRLALTTHDAGGLTQNDFALAEQCDLLFASAQ